MRPRGLWHEPRSVDLAYILAQSRLALARGAAHKCERWGRAQQVLGRTTNGGYRGAVPSGRDYGPDPVGSHVDKQIDDLLPVYLGLAELDPLVFVPLSRCDLPDQVTQALVLGGTNMFGDEVADEVPAGQHLGIGPLGLSWRVVHPGIESLTPDAANLVESECFRVFLKLLVEPVVRAGTWLAGAGHVGYQHVPPDALLGEATQVLRLLADDVVQPGNRVLLLTADRPFDLVDEDFAGFEIAQAVAAAVGLAQCHRNKVRELGGQQSGDELLEVMVSEALVQVLVAALGQRLLLLRENTMVSQRSAACPATRCNRGLRHRAGGRAAPAG